MVQRDIWYCSPLRTIAWLVEAHNAHILENIWENVGYLGKPQEIFWQKFRKKSVKYKKNLHKWLDENSEII